MRHFGFVHIQYFIEKRGESRAFTRRYMPIIDEILVKREQIIGIARKNKAYNVKIFGSVLREEDNPDSDIDLLVECSDECSLFDIISLKYDLEEFLGRQIDVVTVDSIHWALKDKILQEAKPI